MNITMYSKNFELGNKKKFRYGEPGLGERDVDGRSSYCETMSRTNALKNRLLEVQWNGS